jgi:RNA polymerase sigma factor (sigma-70 family)
MAEAEAILLRRFATNGDAAAFAEITQRHAGLVYGTALRVLADVDRAADVAQETFLQLTKDAGTITGSLPGWLHRVATHKAIDVRRRDVSRRQREAQYVENQARETKDWKDVSPHVDEGLRALDPEFREMLISHFLEGRTTRQIAEIQGVSQATVSRRVEAGVNQLRGILRKRGVIVAVGILTGLLGENATQAAPAALVAELGKMALVGGQAAALSAATAEGTSSGLSSLLGTVATVVKTKAVVVAAVAVIGASSVVTYQHVTKSSAKGGRTTSVVAPERANPPQGPSVVTTGRTATQRAQPQTVQQPQQTTGATGDRERIPEMANTAGASTTPETTVAHSSGRSSRSSGGGMGGMMMGGFAMGGGPAAKPDNRSEATGSGGPSGDYYYYHADPNAPKADPNDANDRNSTNP